MPGILLHVLLSGICMPHRSGHGEEVESPAWLGWVVTWQQGWELRPVARFKQECHVRGYPEGAQVRGASEGFC